MLGMNVCRDSADAQRSEFFGHQADRFNGQPSTLMGDTDEPGDISNAINHGRLYEADRLSGVGSTDNPVEPALVRSPRSGDLGPIALSECVTRWRVAACELVQLRIRQDQRHLVGVLDPKRLKHDADLHADTLAPSIPATSVRLRAARNNSSGLNSGLREIGTSGRVIPLGIARGRDRTCDGLASRASDGIRSVQYAIHRRRF